MRDASKPTTGSNSLTVLGVALVTVVYLWLEILYNQALLDLFAQATIDQAKVDTLSTQGKILAAVGFTWALLRGVIARVSNWLGRVVAFVFASVVIYACLSGLYDYVIRNLPPETKVDGFHLAAYRQALIEKNVTDPDVPLPVEAGTVGSVFMISIPLMLFDDRYMVPARGILAMRAKMFEDYYWKKVDEGWRKYDRHMQSLRAAYQQFLDGSRKVESTPAMFRARALERFRIESGGMRPNSRSSMDEFLAQLVRSTAPAAKQYRASQEEIVFVDREGTSRAAPVKGSDLPSFMNNNQFRNYFANRIEAAKVDLLPNASDVEKAAGINDINSSVFVPPMAMITSLLSIIANAANLLWMILILPVAEFLARTERFGMHAVHMFAPVFVLVVLSLTISAMPNYVFGDKSPMRLLEQKMHNKLGAIGAFWSRSAAFQLRLTKTTAILARR